MDFNDTPEEAAFRKEVRAWLDANATRKSDDKASFRARNDDPELMAHFVGNDFREDYKRLNTFIRNHGINIPPLVNAYMGLSPKMLMLGTAINREFGDVEESGILINIDEIADEKKRRHIDSYPENIER